MIPHHAMQAGRSPRVHAVEEGHHAASEGNLCACEPIGRWHVGALSLEKDMPQKAHTEAAEHHEKAAKSHRSAAEHHGKGDHAAGHKHSTEAHGHSTKAHEGSTKAHGKSGEHHK